MNILKRFKNNNSVQNLFLFAMAMAFIVKTKKREVNRDLIRYTFDYLKDNEATLDMLYHNDNISNALSNIFGDDWYMLDIQPQEKPYFYIPMRSD